MGLKDFIGALGSGFATAGRGIAKGANKLAEIQQGRQLIDQLGPHAPLILEQLEERIKASQQRRESAGVRDDFNESLTRLNNRRADALENPPPPDPLDEQRRLAEQLKLESTISSFSPETRERESAEEQQKSIQGVQKEALTLLRVGVDPSETPGFENLPAGLQTELQREFRERQQEEAAESEEEDLEDQDTGEIKKQLERLRRQEFREQESAAENLEAPDPTRESVDRAARQRGFKEGALNTSMTPDEFRETQSSFLDEILGRDVRDDTPETPAQRPEQQVQQAEELQEAKVQGQADAEDAKLGDPVKLQEMVEQLQSEDIPASEWDPMIVRRYVEFQAKQFHETGVPVTLSDDIIEQYEAITGVQLQ